MDGLVLREADSLFSKFGLEICGSEKRSFLNQNTSKIKKIWTKSLGFGRIIYSPETIFFGGSKMRATNLKNLLAVSLLIFATMYPAVPVWADVDIMCTNEPYQHPCVAVISFDARSEPNLPRAFSLDIQVDNDANIVDVTLLSRDYIIHPGTIAIDSQGNVTDYGSPVAPQSDLPGGTLPGLDSNGVTIEMGSLYSPVGPGSPNAPDPCGPLVSVEVDRNCTLTITANVSRAGSSGVVMESPDEAVTVNLPAPLFVDCMGCGCYEGMPDCDQFELLGSPECWCYPRQCLGDADGKPYAKPQYWVSIPDLTILKAAWNKTAAEIVGVFEPTTGVPLACADFDHLPYGKGNYRVSIPDLTILKANWNIGGGPAGTCLPGNISPY
jgi:hypothetical protein